MRTLPTLLCVGAFLLALGCNGSDRSTAPGGTRLSADEQPGSSDRGAARGDNQNNDQGQDNGQVLVDFRGLTPNVLTSATGAIRGVPAGGIPWMIQGGRARLTRDDRLRVDVRGLVLAAGPAAGTNPIPQFRAILSCLVENAGRTGYDTVNIQSDPAPASAEGDATIDQQLAGVPARCLGPVIFVTSPTGAWFAVSG